MTTPLGYDELLQCPFEKAHRIQASAMTKHLFKCRLNHPNKKIVKCPFNQAHQVAAIELHTHISNCKDKSILDTYKYTINTSAAAIPSHPPPMDLVINNSPPKSSREENKSSTFVEEECWDDMDVPAYNPQEYCANANVIRKATLQKPSEKKAFYKSERLRLGNLKSND